MPAPPSPSVSPAPAPPAEAVVPLARGLDVLRHLTDADGTLALAELTRVTGLARSTVDRICATLAHLGYLRLDGRDATLAPPLMGVANAFLGALRVPALLGPLADRLAGELDESVSLAVPDGDDIRFVHQVLRRRALSISFRVGDLLPGAGSAPGLVFRRGADHTDHTGHTAHAAHAAHAVDDQLVEPGLVAVALPVRGPSGAVVCAVSVVSHTSRHRAERLPAAVLGPLSAAVRAMETALAHDTPPTADGPGPGPAPAPGGAVRSLARGLGVLTAFGAHLPAPTLAQLAEATGLPRATARRALLTYEHLGYVRHDGHAYRLTPRVLGLGCAPLSRTTLPRIAAPHLAALSGALGESVGLSVPDGEPGGEYVRVTARVAPRRVLSVDLGVGTRLPAAATAAGQVLAARAGAAGAAEAVADGPEDGLWSVAVPLRGRDGEVVSALDVTAHRGRGERTAWADALRATAALIEADLRVTSRFVTVPHH
ncbi:helix-turn-helix domain-containing protein [Streptomyces sp. NPDC088785]|uniref:helix-turn-helix domain-containing protein n=1 Tax=Streptomyces sp. NPDC088785 TaxID=3365897 RepID=UPI0037F9E47A